jgi:hypothetical protein
MVVVPQSLVDQWDSELSERCQVGKDFGHRIEVVGLESLNDWIGEQPDLLVVDEAHQAVRGWCDRPGSDMRVRFEAIGLVPKTGKDESCCQTRTGCRLIGRLLKLWGATCGVDLWLLFPLGVGVMRLLTKAALPPEAWRQRITRMLGTTEWENEFYRTGSKLNSV